MKYSARPNIKALIIHICILIVSIFLFLQDEPDHWSWPVIVLPYLFYILYLVFMSFMSYKIEGSTLKMSSYAYWKSNIDLNKLISVHKRENGWFKRSLGMPKTTIELYIEREGHLELWTDDEELLERLKAYERKSDSSVVKS